ncbi:MAG: hypothetical protein OXO54_12260 [Chloroflexota bacterium]|nr:hypothetical protein [Chloroflexota bacterium]
MPGSDGPQSPTVLQGAYACDLAPDGHGRAFGAWAGTDWAEETLFVARSNTAGGGWQFGLGRDERDLMARLGAARYRVYAGELGGNDLAPVELAESHTVIQDPAVAVFDSQRLVAWGERFDDRFVVRAWTGAEVETVASTPASLTRPAAAIDREGQPWVAWQAFNGNGCAVVISRRSDKGWTAPTAASVPGQSAWRPALCASAGHGVWLAWDAWTGHHFHVFARRIAPDGALGPAVQVSDLPLLAMDADLAVDADDTAWLAWEQSPPWGSNHRFNETRHLVLAAIDASGNTFQPRSPWGASQAPIPIETFTHVQSAEYIVPVSPRLLVGPRGIELYFQRFRSSDYVDFGWRLERMVYSGSTWSDPETVSPFHGTPDTRYGVAALPDERRVVAHNAMDFASMQTLERWRAGLPFLHGGASPATRERIEVLTLAPPAAAAEPPLRVEFPRYEGIREDTPRVRRDGRSITVGDQAYYLYWGDMHRHSHLSKCIAANDGSPVHNFRWAIDHNRMDFWALTEHLEYMSYNEWRRVEETVGAFTNDGRFEPLFGFEWGLNPGHTNIFYRDQQLGEELRALALTSPSLEDLMERWDTRMPAGAVMAARHFHGHRQPDVFEGFRPAWEPAMEIMQARGDQREWIETFLREGARIGFLGATDHCRFWHFAFCMTGVWATEPTREAIFDAIWNRRTIATSARILLHTEVSGIPMGAEGEVPGDPKLRVMAESAQPLQEIQVFRNGELAHRESVKTSSLDWTWIDRGNPRSQNYYYVRLSAEPALPQGTPAVAYASPVWVTTKDA